MRDFAKKNAIFCKRPGARTHRPFSSLEQPHRLAYEDHLKKPTGPEDENVHIRTELRARIELARTHFAHIFHRRSQGNTHAPPTKTPQIRQTTDGDDDFVHGIIGGAIVLGMILMIYACHSCYIRFCRNRQDNAGAILNLPNMVQLPSQFPIGPPFLHKDDGITLVTQN